MIEGVSRFYMKLSEARECWIEEEDMDFISGLKIFELGIGGNGWNCTQNT